MALATLYGLGLLLQKLEGNLLRENFFRSTFENLWNYYFFKVCGGDEFWFIVFGTNLWGFIVYWGVGGLYTAYDLFKPERLIQYRIQDKTSEPITYANLWKCVSRVLWNQVFVGIPLALALYYPAAYFKSLTYDAKDIPSYETAMLHLIGYILIEEVMFYYTHRLFHEYPALYKRYHKIHHEFTAPISITARYAHMLEDLLSNLLPVVSGPILMGSHPMQLLVWVLLGITATLQSHSGIHLPFSSSPEAHDYHHLKFNVNYGVLGILDSLHNTNYKFVNSVQGERHFASMSLKPVKEIVPDRKKVD